VPAQDVSLTLKMPTPNEVMDCIYVSHEVSVAEWQITLAVYARLRAWDRHTSPVVEVDLRSTPYTPKDYDLMVMHLYRRGWIVSPVEGKYKLVTVKEAREGAW